MAVVADIDNLDLVVEPHEWTPEDRETVRQAIEEHRHRHTDARVAEEMRHGLAARSQASKIRRVEAVFRHGVLEPVEAVALQENQRVRLTIELAGEETPG